MIPNSKLPPDGLDLLDEVCKDAGISLMPLVAKTCRWVDPKTFRLLPVWYPEIHRGAPMYDSKYERQYTNKKAQRGSKAKDGTQHTGWQGDPASDGDSGKLARPELDRLPYLGH